MRKTYVFIAAIVLFTSLSWMIYSSFNMIKNEESRERTLDNLSLLFDSLNINSVTFHQKTILVYFNSECANCKAELEALDAVSERLGNVNLLFLSIEEEITALKFLEQYNLEQYFHTADQSNLISLFGGVVPQIFVFDSGDLIQHYKGEVRIELILQAIE